MSRLDRLLKQGDKAAERMTEAQIRELTRNYQMALKEVRSKVAEGFEKYGSEYAQWQKYNRLANLEKDIGEEVRKLTGKNATNLKTGIARQFEDQYYRTAFALEKSVEAKLGFGVLSSDVIESAIENPLDRIGFLERNRENSQRLRRQLRERLTQGLIQGKAYQDVARELKERMDMGANESIRIARTENHRAQQMGRDRSFQKAENEGVEMDYIWTASLDDRTREDHQEMDDVRADEEGIFTLPDGTTARAPGMTGEPHHDINCRCSKRAEIKGYGPKVRRARNADGAGEIQSYRNYNEWKKGRIES